MRVGARVASHHRLNLANWYTGALSACLLVTWVFATLRLYMANEADWTTTWQTAAGFRACTMGWSLLAWLCTFGYRFVADLRCGNQALSVQQAGVFVLGTLELLLHGMLLSQWALPAQQTYHGTDATDDKAVWWWYSFVIAGFLLVQWFGWWRPRRTEGCWRVFHSPVWACVIRGLSLALLLAMLFVTHLRLPCE